MYLFVFYLSQNTLRHLLHTT